MRFVLGVNSRALQVDVTFGRWSADDDDATEVVDVSAETQVCTDNDGPTVLGFRPNPEEA